MQNGSCSRWMSHAAAIVQLVTKSTGMTWAKKREKTPRHARRRAVRGGGMGTHVKAHVELGLHDRAAPEGGVQRHRGGA
jgi:hypothetical protein